MPTTYLVMNDDCFQTYADTTV
ncbi:hypothetical protein OOU_Y34scaffold00773g15 [Pyricularia oryzae Y34]|uniref:Uncharacterized protein n=1 Tax=Pyricularia oryzae (strain Y34) TaxID=1143189 RepID=A0AA97NQ91_PYRO3|nr:hypothetical protein OOU_Y34scaffold00773g15 [Pyricularia oryzae Y34]